MKSVSPISVRGTIALAMVGLLAVGCASSKAPESAATSKRTVEDISRQWKQGDDLVKEGQAKQAEAQQMIDEAGRIMRDADELVSRGETLKSESEAAFRATSLKAQ